MIKQLINLDFYAMKPLSKFMFPFLLIPIILGIAAGLGISMMVTLTFAAFMLNVLFSITERSHFNKLYGTLPIEKSAHILSRYLFSLIIIGITAMIASVIFIVLSVLMKGTVNWIYGAQYLSLSIFTAILFISIQYPFYYKFDYTRASVMSILPYIACFAIGMPILNQLMKNQAFYEDAMKIVSFFQSNTVVLIIMLLAFSLVLIVSSYFLSKTMRKKEF